MFVSNLYTNACTNRPQLESLIICLFTVTFLVYVHRLFYFYKENVLTERIIDKRTSFKNIETTFFKLVTLDHLIGCIMY